MNARERLRFTVALFIGLLGIGTLGYRFIEGWGWFDSLYHTVITLSTVGYAEVHELSAGGRWFTVALIIGGFAGLALAVQALARLIIEGELRELVWRRRMERELTRISDHVVVCGYGSMGRLVADELAEAGLGVVVIDLDPDHVRDALDDGRLVIEGDATSDETLLEARVGEARTAICALSSDAANVFATLSLRVLNPDITIVSRYDQLETRQKLLRAGADQAVSPKIMGGRRVVNCVLRPASTQLMDKALHGRELDLRMDEFVVLEDSPLIGKPLAELHLRKKFGLLIVAIRHPDGAWLDSPGPEVELEGGETVVVIGKPEGVGELLGSEGSRLRPAGD